MTYCEDCKFFIVASSGAQFARCDHPKARKELSYDRFVARELDKPAEQLYCSTMRVDACGEDAKLFESKL